MIDELKKALRLSHDKLDTDIKSNVDACILDLQRVGVKIPSADSDLNRLEMKAVELYIKWQYDYGGKGDQYRKNYETLRDSLSLSNGYNGMDGVSDV